MTKVVVTGAAGKMGSRIISLVSAMADVKLVGSVEATGHPLSDLMWDRVQVWERRA